MADCESRLLRDEARAVEVRAEGKGAGDRSQGEEITGCGPVSSGCGPVSRPGHEPDRRSPMISGDLRSCGYRGRETAAQLVCTVKATASRIRDLPSHFTSLRSICSSEKLARNRRSTSRAVSDSAVAGSLSAETDATTTMPFEPGRENW